jgi:hypothetical protein
MENQTNSYAAQMNSNNFKRHLLIWLIGFSLLNVLLLFVVILLIIFAPALVHRCAAWKFKSQLKRREYIMKKHHLVEQSPPLDLEPPLPPPLPTVSKILDTNVVLTPSYSELVRQLDEHKHLIGQLTRDLESERVLRKTNSFAPRSQIH